MTTTLLFHTAEDRLGDALIKLPAILALKKALPQLRLIWSAGAYSSAYQRALWPLVDGSIDEIIAPSGYGTRWFQTLVPMSKRRFEIIVVSAQSIRPTLALRRLRHDRFIAPAGNFMWSDSKPDKEYLELPIFRQTQILLELACETALPLNPLLDIPARFRAQARALLPDGTQYIGLAPGAGGRDKCWPREHFVEVAKRLSAAAFVPVFFLGPEEIAWYEPLRNLVPDARFPELDLPLEAPQGPVLTIALAARMRASIANDSGAGHLLAAGGQPLVLLYGRTSARKFAPPYVEPIVLTAAQFGGEHVAAIPLDAAYRALEDICG